MNNFIIITSRGKVMNWTPTWYKAARKAQAIQQAIDLVKAKDKSVCWNGDV